MSWGERSCKHQPCIIPQECSMETCNVNCRKYEWDEKTMPDSKQDVSKTKTIGIPQEIPTETESTPEPDNHEDGNPRNEKEEYEERRNHQRVMKEVPKAIPHYHKAKNIGLLGQREQQDICNAFGHGFYSGAMWMQNQLRADKRRLIFIQNGPAEKTGLLK